MINISDILSQLGQYPAQPLTPDINNNLQNLKEICDIKFTNQITYGNSLLNQKMLLNPNVVQLLTPEVLLYLFTNKPNSKTCIYRNLEGSISLSEAIFNGFKEKFDNFYPTSGTPVETKNIMDLINNIFSAIEMVKAPIDQRETSNSQ